MRAVQKVEAVVGVLGEVLGVTVGQVEVGDRLDEGEQTAIAPERVVAAANIDAVADEIVRREAGSMQAADGGFAAFLDGRFSLSWSIDQAR